VSERAEPVAILFDWGETLVSIPGMIHSAERHMACLERLYSEPCEYGASSLAQRCRIPWETFRQAYWDAARGQMARSAQSLREHSFEDRFRDAFRLAQVADAPVGREVAALVARFGDHIVRDAMAVEGALEAVTLLAQRYRLGVVSNYPNAPLVERTLERFGMRAFFSAVVVSGEFGWLKPHPSVFREALRRLDARPERTLFVGDDLRNDVKGPKALGLRTAWFAPGCERVDDPDIDVQLADLRELPQWCSANLNNC
jgi:putative hydrolase of the HAD superfamily